MFQMPLFLVQSKYSFRVHYIGDNSKTNALIYVFNLDLCQVQCTNVDSLSQQQLVIEPIPL